MRAAAILVAVLLLAGCARAQDDVDTEEDFDGAPCFPSNLQLIKRANEECDEYAGRVCEEARHLSKDPNCSLTKCEAETRMRCPFRDLVRGRANMQIKAVAQKFNIWEETAAAAYCNNWYGKEIANLTRIAAVWDALSLLPCYENEDSARFSTCWKLESDGIAPLHPLAKWCYRSLPIELNIGWELSVQCCYSEDLQLLTLGHKGAGSVDYVSSVASDGQQQLDEHFTEDVLPYLACCALSDNCNKYAAARPAALQAESATNVTHACAAMENVYKWAPYHKYPPPYHPMSTLYNEWDSLKLNATSKIPTEMLSQVLAHAKAVVLDVSKGKNPYHQEANATTEMVATSAHHEATEAPAHHEATESNHTVTKDPEETHHELGTSATESATHVSRSTPHATATTEPVLEKVLEAVLQGQTRTTQAEHATHTDAPARRGSDSDRERERRRRDTDRRDSRQREGDDRRDSGSRRDDNNRRDNRNRNNDNNNNNNDNRSRRSRD